MRYSTWLNRGTLFGLVLGALLTSCGFKTGFSISSPPGHGKQGDAITACVRLSKATDAYVEHPSNSTHAPPPTLSALIKPPWGSSSFLPNGEINLTDPWGNYFILQPRTRADGRPYSLIMTVAPDGTAISQYGIGPKFFPK